MRSATTPTGPSATSTPARWAGSASSRFGALYCLVPWLWNAERLYCLKLVNWHFWISTIGIVLYITAMWVSGIMQGLMWRAYTSLGFLEYSFVETVEAMHPVLRHPRAGRRAVPHRRAGSWPTICG